MENKVTKTAMINNADRHRELNTDPNYIEVGAFAVKFHRFIREEEFKKEHLNEFTSLTNRETQILKLVIKGSNNPTISNQLHISRHTVEQHRKNINRKLHITNLADVFDYATAFDLL